MKLVLAVWAGVSTLPAQPQPVERNLPARALALLRSPQIVDRAWGAYLCGSLLVGDCASPLMAELERAASFVSAPKDGEEYFYVQAMMDALIRLRAAVPASVLMQFDPRWRDEVIILLSRSPGSEEVLLRLDEQDLTTVEWIAVNNQLLGLHSRPMFIRMLKQTQIEHFFEVFDEEPDLGYAGGIGDDAFMANIPVRRVPSGFPPIGIYELRNSGAYGTTLLAPGPCSNDGVASFTRIEITAAGTQVQPRRRYQAVKPIECLNAYLEAFLGISRGAAKGILRPTTRIRWTNAADLLRRANTAMDANAKALRDFIQGAHIADLVDPAAFRVTIQTHVSDFRRDRTVPLPPIASREVRLN